MNQKKKKKKYQKSDSKTKSPKKSQLSVKRTLSEDAGGVDEEITGRQVLAIKSKKDEDDDDEEEDVH